MNFQELMCRATENNINASKQKKKSGHLHKDSTPGVSSAAVQAFIVRKQQEDKRRQAGEEAARLARIQTRIDQNLQNKRGIKRGKPNKDTALESSVSNPSTRDEEAKPAKIPKQEKQLSRGNEKTKSKSVKSGSTNSTSKQSQKPSTEQRKEKSRIEYSKSTEKETKQANSKRPKAIQPPNFKELLEMAEKNKYGVNNMNKKAGQNKTKCKELPTQTMKERYKKDKQKPVRKEVEIKQKAKELKAKDTEPTQSKIAKQHNSLRPADRTKTVPSRDIVSGRPPRPGPYHGGPYGPPSRLHQQSNHHPRPQRKYVDYYDDDEDDDDDMDGFIDDSSMGGDVSAHIREIFGYDRRRFADTDDMDESAMESSYSQIEKEEHRSSKIAKLEDDIAFLKEQADLKRQKEQLMKDRKKSKNK